MGDLETKRGSERAKILQFFVAVGSHMYQAVMMKKDCRIMVVRIRQMMMAVRPLGKMHPHELESYDFRTY